MKKVIGLFLLLVSISVFAGSKDLNGVEHDLFKYKGKYVLMNNFATWCSPCIEEMSNLVILHNRNPDLVVLIYSADSEEFALLRKFAKDNLVPFPIIPIPLKKLDVIPATELYNPDGKLIKTFMGVIRPDQIESYLK